MLMLMSLITVDRTNVIKLVEMGFVMDSGKEESKCFFMLQYDKLNYHLV